MGRGLAGLGGDEFVGERDPDVAIALRGGTNGGEVGLGGDGSRRRSNGEQERDGRKGERFHHDFSLVEAAAAAEG